MKNWISQNILIFFFINCIIISYILLIFLLIFNDQKYKSWLQHMYPSVQFSRSVVSDSLPPHESQHTRPPCPSPTSRIYSNPCPSSRWCHPTISSSVVPFSSCPLPPSIRVFSNESTLCMRWPKYWSFSFSISPSNESLLFTNWTLLRTQVRFP